MNSLQIFADQLHGLDPALLEGVLVPVLLAHAVEVVDVSFRNERGWVLRVSVESAVDADPAAENFSPSSTLVLPPGEPTAPSGGASGAFGKPTAPSGDLRERAPTEPSAEEGAHVTLAELTEISRDLSAALDVADFIPQRYSLEVSSPGLDRPLRGLRDFRRFLGRLAKIHLDRPAADGQRVLRGRLSAVQVSVSSGEGGTAVPAAPGEDPSRGDGVTLTIEVDGKEMTVPLASVTRAHLVFEMPGQPKKRPNGHRKAKHGRAQSGAGPHPQGPEHREER